MYIFFVFKKTKTQPRFPTPMLLKNRGRGTPLGPAAYETQTLVVAKGGQALDTEHMLGKLALSREPRVNLTMRRSTVGSDYLPSR